MAGAVLSGAISMLMTSELGRRKRTLHGRAVYLVQGAGAIREFEESGRMQNRAEPHGRDRAFDTARGSYFAQDCLQAPHQFCETKGLMNDRELIHSIMPLQFVSHVAGSQQYLDAWP